MCAFEQELVELHFFQCWTGVLHTISNETQAREGERAWNFFFYYYLRSSFLVQWEVKIVYNISFCRTHSRLDIPMALGQNISGKFIFSSFLFCFFTFHRLLHISHFSPLRIFGSCYFCNDCRRLHGVCNENICTCWLWSTDDWQESPPPSSSPMLLAIRICSERISANCNWSTCIRWIFASECVEWWWFVCRSEWQTRQ